MSDFETPYVHGAGEPTPEDTLLSPEARVIVDRWLAGVRAVREGTFDVFFIETTDHSGRLVKPENAEEVERNIIEHFGPHYPEIVPQLDEQ